MTFIRAINPQNKTGLKQQKPKRLFFFVPLRKIPPAIVAGEGVIAAGY